jgi:hypothetical protein
MKRERESEREREREEKESGEAVRDTTFGGGGGQETVSPVSQVPRQCPLVLLPEVMHMIGINFTIMFEEKKLNSVAVVRKRTIPTERPPLFGEVSANLCG